MKVMILAAGLGTRLRPLTDGCPKPLVPLMLRPMLGYLLEQLRQYEVQEVVINLHHHAEQLRQWLGDGSQWGYGYICPMSRKFWERLAPSNVLKRYSGTSRLWS